MMPWRGWDNPTPAYGRNTGGWRSAGPKWLFNRNSVTDADIDQALKAGKNPRRVFGRKMSQMSPEDRKKVEARIKAREGKRKQ